MRRLLAFVVSCGLVSAPPALAKGARSSGGHHSSSAHSSGSHKAKSGSTATTKSARRPKRVHVAAHATTGGTHVRAHTRAAPRRCAACPRDRHGRILRSPEARREFMRRSGYPHGRNGYVIDHRVPLECGGSDAPSNMQWETRAEAKAKDRTEARCRT
jgi:hypothetical protein